MISTLLSPEQRELLSDENRALADLSRTLERLQAPREDLETLLRSIERLEKLFLIVVIGEFNAGKSTLINALLGAEVLEEGVTPTTTRVQALTYGPTVARSAVGPEIDSITAPVDLLRDMEIVDTPGTNALDRRHEAITEAYVPRSDLVLFVTSTDRPFAESESAFMRTVREWDKKIVLVANKVDFLESEAEIEKVRAFLRDSARSLFGSEPQLFLVSAREALRGKLGRGPGDSVGAAAFSRFEAYLRDTLDDRERIRLKLSNPLGVALRLTSRYLALVDDRDRLLADDFATLEEIDRQLALFREDLGREFRFRLSDVDNILHQFETRGQAYLDETVRLARVVELANRAKIRLDFQQRVVADAPARIEAKVDETIDWLIEAELRQWRTLDQHLERRRARHTDRLIGELGSFAQDRQKRLDGVGRTAQRAVESYDHEEEAARLAESVRSAVAGIALLEVGALGLGAIVTLLATTQVVDVTGILAAGSLAVIGLLVLPAKRRRAKKELTRKIVLLREELMAALTREFDREVERSVHRIDEAIAPYTRFVRAERTQLDENRASLTRDRDALLALKGRVEELR